MNLSDAKYVAEDLRSRIEPACEPGMAEIVGSVRRKRQDVSDIEILGLPILKPPRPEFGMPAFLTIADQILYDLVKRGCLFAATQNGPKKKKFPINLTAYNLRSLNPFYVEFYLCTPPAQWGVLSVIRTGPNKPDDNFSTWCVTNRNGGGGLPDGYIVKHGAVWTMDQVDHRREPRSGESPIEMPTEESFFQLLGIDWIEPQARHARWRRMVAR